MSHDPTITKRISDLHAWYQTSVLRIPLTPEVQRLWFTFFKQGHNGHQLALVVRYLRVQIKRDKRQQGALKISNLLEQTEEGTLLNFAEDLALAEQWQRGGSTAAAPLPPAEMAEAPAPASAPFLKPATAPAPKLSPEQIQRHLAALTETKRSL